MVSGITNKKIRETENLTINSDENVAINDPHIVANLYNPFFQETPLKVTEKIKRRSKKMTLNQLIKMSFTYTLMGNWN